MPEGNSEKVRECGKRSACFVQCLFRPVPFRSVVCLLVRIGRVDCLPADLCVLYWEMLEKMARVGDVKSIIVCCGIIPWTVMLFL